MWEVSRARASCCSNNVTALGQRAAVTPRAAVLTMRANTSIVREAHLRKPSACIYPVSIPERHRALNACPIWRLAFLTTSATAQPKAHQHPATTAGNTPAASQFHWLVDDYHFSTSSPSVSAVSRSQAWSTVGAATVHLPALDYYVCVPSKSLVTCRALDVSNTTSISCLLLRRHCHD
jgi:hypothetical protein